MLCVCYRSVLSMNLAICCKKAVMSGHGITDRVRNSLTCAPVVVQEAPILKVKLGGGQVAGGGEMGSTPTSVASPQIKVYTPEPAASAAAGSTAESDISTMAAGQSSKGDHDTARVADDDEEGWQEVSKPKKDKSKAQEKQKGGSGKSHRKPSAKKTKPKQGNSSKVLVVRRAKQESV